jgi:hypothetical protein
VPTFYQAPWNHNILQGNRPSFKVKTMTDNILTVDIVSDVICPWCFVGKRRLERALKALPGGKTVHVCWLRTNSTRKCRPPG